MKSQNQVLIRLSRPPTKGEISFGYGCRHEKFVSQKDFDYRKQWFLIDGLRWTNKGLAIGEIN